MGVAAKKRAWLQRTFKLDIVLVFSSLIIVTMSAVIGFTYVQNRKDTLRLANRVMDQTAQAVIGRTIEYLSPAQTVAELSAELLAGGGSDTAPGGDVERFFLRILEIHPQIGLVYYGDERGNFVQANRDFTNDTLVTRHIDRDRSPPNESYFYRDQEGQVTRRTVSEDIQYDPRVRPWYEGAKDAPLAYWTDIYIFSSPQVPGITAAFPAFAPGGGPLRGVVGADLTLSQLSTFLGELSISERGVAFLMDERGQLIAFPGKSTVITDDKGQVRPLLASEMADPWVTAAIRAYTDRNEKRFEFEHGGETTIAFVAPFPPSFGKPWNTVVLVPADDFLGAIKRNSVHTVAISLGILLIAVYLGLVFAKNIARPVEYLTEEVNKIRDFHLGERIQVKSYIHEIQAMEAAINSMKNGLAAFRLYVPADLVRQMIRSGEEAAPGGQERELTLLFTDITNFTSIAEEMTAREIMVSLSEYFDVISAIISEEKGVIDKYIGDSVMAFWGAPLANERHALSACRAVLRSMRALDALDATRRERGSIPFQTRFGVHTGFSIVGNVGSRERLNYTALGDNVNLASRLEGVNKYYGTRAIISQDTYRYARHDFVCRPLDVITVKGRSAGVKIYELLAEAADPEAETLRAQAGRFRAAFELYLARDWAGALEDFESLARANGADRPAELFVERCRSYLETPPGDDWSGVWRMREK